MTQQPPASSATRTHPYPLTPADAVPLTKIHGPATYQLPAPTGVAAVFHHGGTL